MTTAMMLPVAERLDRAGFSVIELMGLVQFDAPVRYLKEDPWERIRLVRQRVQRTPLQSLIRSRCLLSFDTLPDDINQLWVQRLVANGISRIMAFDGLHDWDNVQGNLTTALSLGATAAVWLTFTDSPVHTDAYYAARARDILGRVPGLEAIVIEDPSGVLTVDRVRTLVPAVRAAIGDKPLELHSHCLTGLAPLVYLEGVTLGVDALYTCIPPLANGAAPPNVQTVARNVRDMGYSVALDSAVIHEIGEHFRRVAEREGLPIGQPAEYDAFHYRHQMAGGVLSNLQAQLAQMGLSDRFEEVLGECARVREDLGWPIIVTPFAQLVVTQAVLNVVQRARYAVVPDEVKKYALGYYGRLPAPVHPDVLDRIVAQGSSRIPLVPPAREPVVPALRAQYPAASDEERLLRFMYAGAQVDEMLAAGPTRTEYPFDGRTPLVRLITELARHPRFASISLRMGDLKLELQAAAELPPVQAAGERQDQGNR